MPKGVFQVPLPVNEPVKGYAPGSAERASLSAMYKKMYNQEPIDVPMYIGSKLIRTDEKLPLTSPQEHAKVLGYLNRGTKDHVIQAIDTALAARERWSQLPWEHRAAIFLRAADLLAGPYRDRMNAATMLDKERMHTRLKLMRHVSSSISFASMCCICNRFTTNNQVHSLACGTVWNTVH